MAIDPTAIDWDDKGLIPVVIQASDSGTVLMLGYTNATAIEQTVDTGFVHFWSRSRNELWKKGATSGNTLRVDEISLDCDNDALLIRATPSGPTCHTLQASCFHLDNAPRGVDALQRTVSARSTAAPEGSYTASLIGSGTDEVARKVIEEAGEVVLAAKNHQAGGPTDRVVEEAADLVYHLLVLLAERGIEFSAVEDELDRRAVGS
ncbi:MAG: bifunctional phosphoribosyl-AMP cyclohydrolase/phosphoribosyl-ATP diphosphatase HisIE [Acidimicrobiia bacterium]